MKAVHEREMVVYGSIRWLYTYGSLEWVYNSTTIWKRYLPSAPYGYDATHRDPDLNWLDNEAYLLDTRYITDLYNATRNLVGHYYKYDESFTPLYFRDYTIDELPPTEEPSIALQSISDTLNKLEWIKLTSWSRGYLRHDGANWSWNPSGLWGGYTGSIWGSFSGSPYVYQGWYTPAFIPLLVPETLQSDLTIIFHFDYSEWCNPDGQCNPMWYSFSRNVSVEQSGIAPDGSGGCPEEPPQDIPVDIKMDVHQGYSVEESPDDVYGENIWGHELTNTSRNWFSSVDCIKWGGIAGRSSWYGYNGDEWTGSWTSPYGLTSRWKYFYNRIDIGGVDSDTWLTLYQEPLILRQSYPADYPNTDTSAGRWYSASTSGNLTLDRISAHIKFEYPGEISFVTEREEWCGDGCSYPMLVIGSSANLSNGNMYDSVEIGNLTLSYNSLIDYRGPLGNNWTHNYNIHLSSISDTAITLLDEDGTSIKFTDDDSDGIYESETRFGEYSTIIKNVDNTYTLTSKYRVRYYFNPDGKLTGIEDRNGNVQSLGYVGDNLTTITDSVGRVTSLTYNTASQITNITDPAGRTTEFYYDLEGNLTQIKNPAGNSWYYTYDSQNRLISKQDPEGNLYTYSYDEEDRLTSSKDPDNNTISIQYIPENNQTIVTDPLGNQTDYAYDKALNVWASITDPLGNTVSKTWDINRNNLASQDALGNTTTNTYDERGNLLTIQDTQGNTTTYTYESVYNQILSETNPLGNTTTYEYDTRGNRTKTIDALGYTIEYTYTPDGNLHTTKDPRGNITTNTYDEYGNLSLITDALGNTTTYTYDITGNITSSRDPAGRTSTYTYNNLNQLVTTTDPQGNITEYTYDANGNRTSFKDAQGNITQYQHDSQNRLIKTQDQQGNTTEYYYDANDNQTGAKDPQGNITTNTYDSAGRLIQTTDPQGHTTSYTYDPSGNRISVTDTNGNITTYTYNNLNQLISTRDPQGNVTSYTYDTIGRQTSVTDPLNRTTTYTYDALGRTTGITDAEGNTTLFTYDSAGNKIREEDPEVRITNYTYDNLNRLTEIIDPAGRKTTYTYDVAGNRTSIKDHSGNTWFYTYDSLNYLITETDPQGNTTQYTYDANGNKTSVTDPLGRITRYTYNSLNQLTTITDPLNGQTTFTYDKRGNRTSIRDANGHTRTYTYDNLNRLIEEKDHLNNTTTYIYNAKGDLISKATPNGNTINYTYDSMNRLLTKTLPDGEIQTNTYDKVGNLINQENSKTTIENTYDTKNRLISQTIIQSWQDGSQTDRTIQYTYDSLGNRISMIDPEGGITTYTYDLLTKNLISIISPEGKTTYTYDTLNRRTKMDYLNKTQAEYTYDILGRIIQLTNYDSSGKIISSYSYTYDKAGNRINMTTMDKTVDYTYDNLNRLIIANTQGWLPIENWQIVYTYDPVGNRLSMDIDSSKPALPWYNEYGPTLDEVPFMNKPIHVTYAYNEIDQLIYEFGQEELKGLGYGSPYEIYYDYDPDGNITQKTLFKGWSSYPPSAGSEKVTTYTYDAEDRLARILFPNNQTNTFYDCFCGAKQMEYTDAKGEVTRYFLDGDQVLFEYDGNNQIKSRYTNGPGIDEKISFTRYNSNGQKTTYYYHYDALGSVTAMTDEKGKVVETYDYDPFGVIIDHDRNVTKNLYTYTGRNYLPDAGIYYYRNRYHDPRVGRFGQVDPLLHQPSRVIQTFQPFARASGCQTCWTSSQSPFQTIPISRVEQNISAILEHPYVYVRNNPINYSDPTGEKIYVGWQPIGWTVPVGTFYHTFIRIKSQNGEDFSMGFDPTGNIFNSPGNVKGPEGFVLLEQMVYRCDDKDKKLEEEILRSDGSPPNYKLFSYNCYHWRNDMISKVGLNIPLGVRLIDILLNWPGYLP